MHSRAPRSLPSWSQLVAALNHPSARELAKFLGVSERTIYHYARADSAPRAVLLALFWETDYGLSALDCELTNAVRVWKSLSDSLGHDAEMLRARIRRIEALGGFGTANAPYFRPVTTAIGS